MISALGARRRETIEKSLSNMCATAHTAPDIFSKPALCTQRTDAVEGGGLNTWRAKQVLRRRFAPSKPPKKASRHPPERIGAARQGERIAGSQLTMPPHIELRSSPLAVELSVILDVLADVDFDLACSSQQATITRRLHDLMTRDRQGLGRAIGMLRELAARQQQEAERVVPEHGTGVVASSR